MEYDTYFTLEPEDFPGVRLSIYRMSLGRRIELAKQVRTLGQRLEFLEASNKQTDQTEASLITGEIDRMLLGWGLRGIEGLTINGTPATPETLIGDGPETLCRVALAAIKSECGLTGEERKN